MMNIKMAYNRTELEKFSVLTKAQRWYKSGFISQNQLHAISKEYTPQLYAPTFLMRVLLFIFSFFAIQAIAGFLSFLIHSNQGKTIQIILLIIGIGTIWYTDRILIKEKRHYKSGTTEAFIYSALFYIGYGLLGHEPESLLWYPLVGFTLTTLATLRYLDVTTLLASVFFFMWLLFQLLFDTGGEFINLMPFLFLLVFISLFFFSKFLQKKITGIVYEDLFVVFDVIVLLVVYTAGNYFVVRELSVELMELSLADGKNIPLAWLFYMLTALIPLLYLYWGITQKSTLFLRVALLCIGLTVLTFKYYFSLGAPVITITIAGALLIAIALLCMNYLKIARNGFTRERLLTDQWNNPNLSAFISSQTLGGNVQGETHTNELGGGKFGGGGAGNNY